MQRWKSFYQFQTESVFWKNKWNNFVAFKIPLCHASACTSLGEFKIALALSAVKGSLQCVCNTLLQVTQRIAFFPNGTRVAISVLKLLGWSVSLVLYSAWPLSSHISLEPEISDLSFERSNSSFLDAVSYLYIYIILSLGTAVCGMKRWVLALTILRGEEQNTSEMSALL